MRFDIDGNPPADQTAANGAPTVVRVDATPVAAPAATAVPPTVPAPAPPIDKPVVAAQLAASTKLARVRRYAWIAYQFMRPVIVALAIWLFRVAAAGLDRLRRPTPEQRLWTRRIVVLSCLATGALGTTWAVRASWDYWRSLPTNGLVTFESEPGDSEILVDGAVMGRTPIEVELPPGTHVIEFKRRRQTRTIKLEVANGERFTKTIDWRLPETGRLNVMSDPPGAQVLVDGRDRGTTPLMLDDIVVGSHTVVVRNATGSVRKTITVRGGHDTEVNETIQASRPAAKTTPPRSSRPPSPAREDGGVVADPLASPPDAVPTPPSGI
jgi:hypothetical protein